MLKPPFLTRRALLRACFLAGLTALGGDAMSGAAPDAADPTARRFAAADVAFGFRLLRRLDPGDEGSVFFSPFSVSSALLMVLAGAGGETKRVLASALALESLTPDQISRATGLLLSSLSYTDPKVQLSVANALWANRGVTFNPDFERRCRQFYGARASTLDLASPAAADTINGWVSKNTHGRITRLVSPRDIAHATAVLTNVVYFHGQWQTPFDKADTQDAPFTLPGGATKTVPLMRQSGSLPYLETSEFQAVGLPYGAGRVRLYVFLPKPGSTLDAFLGTLDTKAWSGWLAAMRPTRLTLLLPRFKAHSQATLNPALTALGLGAAFGPGADFRPMGLGRSFLSAVIHKAVLEVDEEGTVAAAATGGSMMSMAVPAAPQMVMRVDHPFFCAIRDDATGTLLFAGAIRNPQ